MHSGLPNSVSTMEGKSNDYPVSSGGRGLPDFVILIYDRVLLRAASHFEGRSSRDGRKPTSLLLLCWQRFSFMNEEVYMHNRDGTDWIERY